MKLTARDKYLQAKYGITQTIYLKMLAHGKGGCWICAKPPKAGKNLHIDHDHYTKQVRGLLDWLCNKRLIGRSRREHAWKYRKAAEYLESTKDWRV